MTGEIAREPGRKRNQRKGAPITSPLAPLRVCPHLLIDHSAFGEQMRPLTILRSIHGDKQNDRMRGHPEQLARKAEPLLRRCLHIHLRRRNG